MKRSSVRGETTVVLYTSQQAVSSCLDSDTFDFWNVKDVIKMFYELCVSQWLVRVALKTAQVTSVTEASIKIVKRKVDKSIR